MLNLLLIVHAELPLHVLFFFLVVGLGCPQCFGCPGKHNLNTYLFLMSHCGCLFLPSKYTTGELELWIIYFSCSMLKCTRLVSCDIHGHSAYTAPLSTLFWFS